MYKNLLTKKFFRDNPFVELSAQRIIYSILGYDGIEEFIDDTLKDQLNAARKEEIREEKHIIMTEDSPEGLFKLLRKNFDMLSRSYLTNKALEYED